jgi:beta-lactamase regulating signal transducer with metallopeptidase domain/thiol-disulfide isomerase/thioredoxin
MTPGYTVLIDSAAKGIVVLAITAVAAYLLWRNSAATLHRLWTVGFVVLLLVPAIGLMLPQHRVKVVPPLPASRPPASLFSRQYAQPGQERAAANKSKSSSQRIHSPVATATESALRSIEIDTARSADGLPLQARSRMTLPFLAAIWALVAGLLLARLTMHHVNLFRTLRRCTPLAGAEWESVLAETTRHLGITRHVRLLTDAVATMPATAGSWRPTVLLPADAVNWPDSRRRAVLLHELAHVKRCDVLTQLLAGSACALHWFNPLVWYGLAQMRKLRELACDDLVLAGGQLPSDYAATLLDIARSYRPRRSAGVVGMARGTNVERRILAILDTARNRLPMTRTAAAALVVAALMLILGFGSVRLETKSARAAETAAEAAPQNPDERVLEILITDESGAPLAGASLHASTWEVEGGKDYPSRNFRADEQGEVRVPIPRRLKILRLWPAHPSYVPEFINFAENTHGDGERIPDKIHFQLARGTQLSGRIVDDAGKPIAGVKVEVSVEVREPAWGNDPDPMISTWLTDEDFNSPAPITDLDGRWSIDNAPAAKGDKNYEFRLKITHDAYTRDSEWGEHQREQGVTTAMLRDGTATITLQGGVTLVGTVVDSAGKPVTKGLVIWSDQPYWAEGVNETQIGDQGEFRTIPLKPGEYPITVAAPGYQPVQQKIQAAKGMKPLRFELVPGKKLVLQIANRRGEPISDAYVGIGTWRGSEALYNEKHPNVPESGIPRSSDKQGVYTWDWAPEDAVMYRISKKGYAEQEISLVAKSTPHTVTLPDERVATGMVTDAETGRPVTKFVAMPVIVFRTDFYHTRREDAQEGRDGRYELPLTGSADPNDHYRVRFEADGYQSLLSNESFGPLDGRATLSVVLKPAPAQTGQVLDAEGLPVANAMVLEASASDVPTLSSTEPAYDARPLRTDSQGNFKFHATGEPVLVRAIHDRGFAEVRREPREPIGTLRLLPWARLEGCLVQDGQPIGNQLIIFTPTKSARLTEPRFQDRFQQRTDPGGKFAFERVPPIAGSVRAYLGPWQESPLTSAESAPLALAPGERRTIVLGGEGATVTGRVVPTGRGDVPLDAHWSLNYLVARTGELLPTDFPKLGFEPANDKPIELSWLDDPHYQEWQTTRRHYFVKLSPDGRLRVSGVPKGEYDLVIQLYEQPAGCLVQTVGRSIVPVEVTDEDVAAGGKTIGDVEVACRVGPRVGENMQSYKFIDADARERSVLDMQGQFVLLHVWASWCAPCVEAFPDMKATVDELPRDAIHIAGLNIDADPDEGRNFAAAKGLNWGQTYVGDDSEVARQLAISSAPAYFLVGPEGNLVASSSDWSEIKKSIEASMNKRRE